MQNINMLSRVKLLSLLPVPFTQAPQPLVGNQLHCFLVCASCVPFGDNNNYMYFLKFPLILYVKFSILYFFAFCSLINNISKKSFRIGTQNLIPFHSCIVLHCVSVPQFLQSPVLDDVKYSVNNFLHTSFHIVGDSCSG